MSDILTMLASVQIYIFALTMFPCRYENGDASDGLLIFNLARSRNGEESSRWVAFYESCVRRYAPDGRVEIRNKPAAARLAFHAAVTLQSLDETACAQSAAALEREWQRGAMSAPEEVFLLDLLATGALMRRWPAGPQTLDAWSGRMMALAPGNASAMGTAGACLVVLGRFAAGRAHLTLSYEAAGGEPFDRFLETLFLARAACGEENAAMALTWLEKAQAAQTELEGLNPMPPYVKYTTAMLARTQAAINAGDDRAGRDTPLQDSGSRAPVI